MKETFQKSAKDEGEQSDLAWKEVLKRFRICSVALVWYHVAHVVSNVLGSEVVPTMTMY